MYDLPTPNYAGSSNLESIPGPGPGTERKGSGVSGSEGWTKTNFIFGFLVPETPLHTYLGTHGYFLGEFTEANSISARAGVAVPAGNRFGS